MVALLVDDEKRLLNSLSRAVQSVPEITETAAFDDEYEALEFAKSNKVDVAFLDIKLHEMDGITLAKELISLHPLISIVFCTGYESYALDAIKMHIDAGYLMKPVRAQEVYDEISHILKKRSKKKLQVSCFGEFDVFIEGKTMAFSRKRAKELFAFLIDRRGHVVSVPSLAIGLLSEDTDPVRGKNIIYQAFKSLRSALLEYGVDDVILTSGGGYCVDPSKIDCDYFRALDGDPNAVKAFDGRYMEQYPWAEATLGYLIRTLGKN